MKITLIPQRRDDVLTVSKDGDTLIINGEPFDFSSVPDGATLLRDAVQCDLLVSDIERVDGILHLSLILPYAANAAQQTLFPTPCVVTSDGVIPLPTDGLTEKETV